MRQLMRTFWGLNNTDTSNCVTPINKQAPAHSWDNRGGDKTYTVCTGAVLVNKVTWLKGYSQRIRLQLRWFTCNIVLNSHPLHFLHQFWDKFRYYTRIWFYVKSSSLSSDKYRSFGGSIHQKIYKDFLLPLDASFQRWKKRRACSSVSSQRVGITRSVGYLWWERWNTNGYDGLGGGATF